MTTSNQGKRSIILVRSATDDPEQVQAQLSSLRAYAASQGIVVVEEVRILPMNRDFVSEMIRRKQTRNDFDALLIRDWTRLSRDTLSMHGMRHDLEQAGIEVTGPFDVEHGDYSRLIHAMSDFTNAAYLRGLSRAIRRSRESLLSNGKMLYIARPPFGIDRMYLSREGQELYRLRIAPNGEQLQLDAQKDVVQRIMPPSPGYRRQPDEFIVFVPGAPEEIATIRLIFARHFGSAWSSCRIVSFLNSVDWTASQGRKWSRRQVESLIQDPIYLGIGVSYRYRTEYGRAVRLRQDESKWVFTYHPRIASAFVAPELVEAVKHYQITRSRLPLSLWKDRYGDENTLSG